MQKIATYTYQVQPLDVDYSDRIRLAQLFGYLLHAAGMNAMENGFGTDALVENGRAWVASRLAMEVSYYPKAHEGFKIETWVEDFGRVFTTRNFRIYREDGSPMGAGTSVWCMIDLSARKAADLGDTDYSAFITRIPSLIDKPARVAALTGEPVSRHRVKYSDLDFNQHTNSTKYVEWMVDLFPLDLFEHTHVRRLDINYINEAVYGETVDILRQQANPDGCVFEMRRGTDVVCRAKMSFDRPFDLTAYK